MQKRNRIMQDWPGYFGYLFREDTPFPILRDYNSLYGYMIDDLSDWKNIANKSLAWWIRYKRKLAYRLTEDIYKLSGIENNETNINNDITVIIPTSAIPSHPDTSVLEETISTIRHWLTGCEIIITFDGVRDNLKHRLDDYREYIRRVVWKCNHEWKNVLPLVFDEHEHQANMTRIALDYVKTPLILFVEHDTPIVVDWSIEWDGLCRSILEGHANVIRLHHEALVLPEHEYLMLDNKPQDVCGVSMRKTRQWSQRPHLASTAFYKDMLNRVFGDKAKTMIEDIVHGRLIEDSKDVMGWYYWRVWIYTPEGQIKRSYHIDGREDDPKYEAVLRRGLYQETE